MFEEKFLDAIRDGVKTSTLRRTQHGITKGKAFFVQAYHENIHEKCMKVICKNVRRLKFYLIFNLDTWDKNELTVSCRLEITTPKGEHLISVSDLAKKEGFTDRKYFLIYFLQRYGNELKNNEITLWQIEW
jgi:hypothetical protein